MNHQSDSILLNPLEYRMSLYPIKYEDIWDFYLKAVAAFWVPNEISLMDDITHWEKLDQNEQHFILTILAFFACSDFIVNENLDKDFTEKIQVPELKMFYHFQEMIEDIHTQTYQILIKTLVKDQAIQDKLFHSVRDSPTIRAKTEWARKWIEKGSFVQRLAAFACVEGIFFSASFCSIFWLKKRGLMPGLCQSNELISRDEGMHRDMACLCYKKYITNKLSQDDLKTMIKDAVDIETEFIKESLPYKLQGMNAELMTQYVKFVADHLYMSLVGERIYYVENPFPWMVLLSLENKSNFFEKRVSEYSKQSVVTNNSEIVFDADF